MNKTYSIQFRFLATVIIAILAITISIGGLSIYEVDNYVQNQAENYVELTCDNEVAQINDSLKSMEKSVKIMESYLMDFFTSKDDIENRLLQQEVIKKANEMFADVTKHTSVDGAIAYYFRLDPSISDGKSGLFYSKLIGSDEFLSLEPTDILIYEKDDTEHVGWFWQPYEAGKPVWIKPYHNLNNDILMISYVIPMYFEEKFIGVVGMDFDYLVLTSQVHEIEIYENGFAHLENDGEIVCNDKHIDVAKKYLRVSKDLVNGMTLVLSASYEDIEQIRYDITLKILLAVLIVSSLIMFMTILIVQKIVNPLKKLTDASVKLSNGNYDVNIADTNTREIKILSTAFENMTLRLREREELLHLSANRDSLTNLRNTTSYTTWVTKFNKEITNKNADFGVVMLDLNDLKKVNDKYGHKAGDELIASAAKAISDVFKESLVFRIGGDEFLVVLQNGDLDDCENLFIKFDSKCANTFIEKEGVKIPISIAIGFSRFDTNNDLSFADVFKRADEAMYENKRKSKCSTLGV